MSQSKAKSRNRKQKNSQAETTATDIPLSMPDYGAIPSAKTLLDLANEKSGVRLVEVTDEQAKAFEAGEGPPEDDEEVDDDDDGLDPYPITALANAVLYTLSLAAVHCTLDVITITQYSQDMSWPDVLGRLVRLAPALFLALWLLHHPAVKQYQLLRNVFFTVVSVAAGCWLFYSGNEHGYYHVMKRAPPLGTLWVWSVVEMDLTWILVHGVAVVGYVLWNGYGNF